MMKILHNNKLSRLVLETSILPESDSGVVLRKFWEKNKILINQEDTHTFSITTEIPCPTPIHMVHNALLS